MTEQAPLSHIEESQKLEADGQVQLFDFEFLDGSVLNLKPNDSVTYLGVEYEGIFIKMDGVSKYSDDEKSRPKLICQNPNGIFTSLISQGFVDNALVTRRKVLRQNLLNNVDVSETQMWRVRRIVSVNRVQIVLELRDQTDGQFGLAPPRQFIPPEFPQVNLK